MEVEESVMDYGDLNELTKDFMQSLTVENFVDIDFEETLNVTLVKTGEAIGNFNINIKKCVSDENGYDIIFEITAECSGNVEQQISCSFNANAQIIFVDGYLQTKLQIHTEYVKCGELRVNKVTETRLQNDGTLIINRKINDENELDIILTPEESKTYLSDGASLLLMRILSRMDWNQQLKFITLDGDGQICPVIYYPAGTMLLPSDANPNESTSLVKIGRELHRDGKIDHWMFSLFRNGELYSWIHKNSPVYMEFKNAPIQEANEPESEPEPIDKALDQNENETAEEKEITENRNEVNEKVTDDQVEFGDRSAQQKGFFSSSGNFNDDHHALLSTIDEEEHLSVSQNHPGNFQLMSDKDVQGVNKENTPKVTLAEKIESDGSGSTMHLRGLFDPSFDKKQVKTEAENGQMSTEIDQQTAEGIISNVPGNSTERTTTSGSTMHLRSLFDSYPSAKEEKVESQSSTNHFDDIQGKIPNDNLTDRSMTSGSTLHIRGLFDSSFNLKEERNETEMETGSESVINNENSENVINNENSENVINNENSENVDENEKMEENPVEEQYPNDSSSHSKGLFASYKNEMESHETDSQAARTMSSGSTMHIKGLFDGSFNLKSGNNENETQFDEMVKDSEGDADKQPVIMVNEDILSKNGLESFNNEGNSEESKNVAEQEMETDKAFCDPVKAEEMPYNEDLPNEILSKDESSESLPNLYPTHLIDDFDHPTPIPEEDEGDEQNIQNVTEETNGECEPDNQLSSTVSSEKRRGSFKFPLEMFDSKHALETIGRGNSLPQELEPDQNSDSEKGLNISTSIFPPIISPRGDKRMMKLMSRRLSALMKSFDSSVADLDETNKTSNTTENGRRIQQTKLDHESDYHSFNRFTLLSREASNVTSKPDLDSNIIQNEERAAIDAESNELENDTHNLMEGGDALNDSQTSTISRLGQDLKRKSPDEGMGSSDMSAISDGHKTPPLLPSFESFNDYHKFFKSECQTYVENHPEIQKILSDFLQALLIARPNKVLPFASAYFQFITNRSKE